MVRRSRGLVPASRFLKRYSFGEWPRPQLPSKGAQPEGDLSETQREGFETDVIDTCVQEASRYHGEVNVDLIAAIRYVKKDVLAASAPAN